jgi:hypothetical protein
MPTRSMIVVNKSWEAEPLVAVLRSANGRPADFPEEVAAPSVEIPWSDGHSHKIPARAAYLSGDAAVEVWCIKDLMDPAKSASSSEEKARVLPMIAGAGQPPDLVVAVGTASLPDARSFNGSVAVGSSCFLFDPYFGAPNPESRWSDAGIGCLIDEADRRNTNQLMAWLDREARPNVETTFLPPPLIPATPPILIVSSTSVAVSDVNVTNPDNYVWADPAALAAFSAAAPKRTVGSVETTHGVIRLCIPSPNFLFVSGITNRLGYFNSELLPRSYAQNFAASHNAGVTVAWLLPRIMAKIDWADV